MILNKLKKWREKADRWYSRLQYKEIVTLFSSKKSDQNVLLSYITHPFQIKPDDQSFYSHTNTWECLQIAKTWLNYGYNVDIIDWDNSTFLPKKDYSVFIDIHSNMERIAPILGKNCKKILHITGAHWRFQNDAENKRLLALKERTGITLKPRRQVAPSLGIEYADCATILGNAFTLGTFAYSGKPLNPIPLSTTILWLGSSGMVHKGLDLVLEAFRDLPDYNLTICGPVNRESDFNDAYYKELYQLSNIKTIGFIDIRSDQFRKIIENSNALIYPSCSEGQAGSVITCLHAGLIPIISHESGVDVKDFGIELEKSSIDEIIDSIKEISQKPEMELQQMSKEAWRYARKTHTREKFSESYDQFTNKMTNL